MILIGILEIGVLIEMIMILVLIINNNVLHQIDHHDLNNNNDLLQIEIMEQNLQDHFDKNFINLNSLFVVIDEVLN